MTDPTINSHKKGRNPKWHKDEIILALNLYFDKNRGSIDAKNEKIIALSMTLNKLPLAIERNDESKFRNVNGVCLKLSNFLAIDPTYNGTGMLSYSKLDKELFDKYFNDHVNLNKEVARIMTTIEK